LYNGFPVASQLSRPDTLLGAFELCASAYILALAVAFALGYLLAGIQAILIALAADVAATLVIYAFSRVFRNASFYDPYWSLAPIAISLYWTLATPPGNAIALRQIMVVTLVCAWGLRLTLNWARQWKGLKHEDWRYGDLRESSGMWFWIVDLIGIEMMPTLIVFAGCLSLYPALSAGINPVGPLDILAAIVTAGAIATETVADEQLKLFNAKPAHTGKIMSLGLWAYSRHPNYFGEIMFWWGLYLFALAANPGYWWVVAGPLAVTVLFIFASIPLMDNRSMLRRPGYGEHMRSVSALVPWFPRR
jgi:steroid 5-alpha reductase family enzyme